MTFGLCRAIGELEEAIWGDHGHTVDEDVGAGEARVEESLLFSSSSAKNLWLRARKRRNVLVMILMPPIALENG